VIQVRARLGNGRTVIEVSGHDEPAVGGRVCAAVSAITQTALLGLELVAQQHPDQVSVDITEEFE
jgi:uncharacterized protein YsxB (DUF464 family)